MRDVNDTTERLRTHAVVRHDAPASPKQAVPLGNGRLGGMLWMGDGHITLQLAHSDYWRTGGHMDGEFGGYPVSLGRLNLLREPAFGEGEARCTLELSLADAAAVLTVERADGHSEVKAFFDMDRDALAVRWRETGSPPARAAVELEGWRESISLEARGETLLLREAPANTRTAEEEEYLRMLLGEAFRPLWHAQCLAVAAEGAAVRVERDGRKASLVLPASACFDVTIRLAASVGEGSEDAHAARATAALDEARRETPDAAMARHADWWRRFWQRSYLRLDSPDGAARRFEGHWYMLRYLMASSNRGRRPVKFNFGNWLTATDDKRPWGGGYWYYNERDVMLAMLPAGHAELAGNLYELYLDAATLLEKQAEHLFGHGGLLVPETVSPDGAMYLRDRTALYEGPTKFVQLIFSTGLEVALHAHELARYSGDEAFCRDRAYPFMKGVVEFFRLHMRKEADGLWHIGPANAHETWWRVKDDLPDLAGLRAVLPRLIGLSERLGLDADLRPAWREMLEHLAPLPKGKCAFSGEPHWENRGDGIFGLCCRVTEVDAAADVYAPCVFAEDNEMHNCHPVAVYGVYPFGITHARSADRQTGVNTFRGNVHPWMRDNWAADVAVPAVLGLAEEAKALLAHFVGTQWETALDYTERYGKVAAALHAMLLQSHDDVVHLFPSLPADWDAEFRLWAPGPMEVAAERRGGQVGRVRVRSLRDQEIALVNPWSNGPVRVAVGDNEIAALRGEVLTWEAKVNTMYSLTPRGRADLTLPGLSSTRPA